MLLPKMVSSLLLWLLLTHPFFPSLSALTFYYQFLKIYATLWKYHMCILTYRFLAIYTKTGQKLFVTDPLFILFFFLNYKS